MVIGPTFSLIPQRPTIWRAIWVSCSRSDSAPCVCVAGGSIAKPEASLLQAHDHMAPARVGASIRSWRLAGRSSFRQPQPQRERIDEYWRPAVDLVRDGEAASPPRRDKNSWREDFSSLHAMSAGSEEGRRSFTSSRATKPADLQDIYSGSDGTRTRDLRRDRPVKAQPVQSAATLNYRWSRHFLTGPSGCDRLRPAAARQSLCSTRVVGVVPASTTARTAQLR